MTKITGVMLLKSKQYNTMFLQWHENGKKRVASLGNAKRADTWVIGSKLYKKLKLMQIEQEINEKMHKETGQTAYSVKLLSSSDKTALMEFLNRKYTCNVCGHEWRKHQIANFEYKTYKGTQNKPYKCPKCHSTKWSQPKNVIP